MSISFITNWHFPTKVKGQNLMGHLVNVLFYYLWQVRAWWGREVEGTMGAKFVPPSGAPGFDRRRTTSWSKSIISWFLIFSKYKYFSSTFEKLYLLIHVYISFLCSLWPFEFVYNFNKFLIKKFTWDIKLIEKIYRILKLKLWIL